MTLRKFALSLCIGCNYHNYPRWDSVKWSAFNLFLIKHDGNFRLVGQIITSGLSQSHEKGCFFQYKKHNNTALSCEISNSKVALCFQLTVLGSIWFAWDKIILPSFSPPSSAPVATFSYTTCQQDFFERRVHCSFLMKNMFPWKLQLNIFCPNYIPTTKCQNWIVSLIQLQGRSRYCFLQLRYSGLCQNKPESFWPSLLYGREEILGSYTAILFHLMINCFTGSDKL